MHSRQRGCLVCADLLDFLLPPSRWERKQVGKKVDKPHKTYPPQKAPVTSHILSQQQHAFLFRGTEVRWTVWLGSYSKQNSKIWSQKGKVSQVRKLLNRKPQEKAVLLLSATCPRNGCFMQEVLIVYILEPSTCDSNHSSTLTPLLPPPTLALWIKAPCLQYFGLLWFLL